jgi:hypothetical protein
MWSAQKDSKKDKCPLKGTKNGETADNRIRCYDSDHFNPFGPEVIKAIIS